jgi:hypothetical protein
LASSAERAAAQGEFGVQQAEEPLRDTGWLLQWVVRTDSEFLVTYPYVIKSLRGERVGGGVVKGTGAWKIFTVLTFSRAMPDL